MEWLKRLARLRDERQFHLECAAAELRELGFTAQEARRAARRRYGHQSFRAAARELDCDFAALVDSIRTHRGLASPWLQPVALLSLIALIFLLSPQPRDLANNVLIRAQQNGHTRRHSDRGYRQPMVWR